MYSTHQVQLLTVQKGMVPCMFKYLMNTHTHVLLFLHAELSVQANCEFPERVYNHVVMFGYDRYHTYLCINKAFLHFIHDSRNAKFSSITKQLSGLPCLTGVHFYGWLSARVAKTSERARADAQGGVGGSWCVDVKQKKNWNFDSF